MYAKILQGGRDENDTNAYNTSPFAPADPQGTREELKRISPLTRNMRSANK